NIDLQRARNRLPRDNEEITTAATRIHRATVLLLVRLEQFHQVQTNKRVANDVRQQRFPAFHVQIEGTAERVCVHVDDGVVAVFVGLSEPADPFGLQVFYSERAVAFRTWLDRDQEQDFFQPTGDFRIIAGFDVRRKNAALNFEIVIETIDAGVNETD